MRCAAQGEHLLKQRPDAFVSVQELLKGEAVLIKNLSVHDVMELCHAFLHKYFIQGEYALALSFDRAVFVCETARKERLALKGPNL